MGRGADAFWPFSGTLYAFPRPRDALGTREDAGDWGALGCREALLAPARPALGALSALRALAKRDSRFFDSQKIQRCWIARRCGRRRSRRSSDRLFRPLR